MGSSRQSSTGAGRPAAVSGGSGPRARPTEATRRRREPLELAPDPDDPLLRALTDSADEPEPEPEQELSPEAMNQLLGQLDAEGHEEPRVDAATRTSMERAFGSAAAQLPRQSGKPQPPATPRPVSGEKALPAPSVYPAPRDVHSPERSETAATLRFALWLLVLAGIGAAGTWLWLPKRGTPGVGGQVIEREAPEATEEQSVPTIRLPDAPAPAVRTAPAQPQTAAPVAEPSATPAKPSPAEGQSPTTARRGMLKVHHQSDTKAGVFLDERRVGTSPGELSLPAGRHRLLIRTDRGVSYMREVTIHHGQQSELTLP